MRAASRRQREPTEEAQHRLVLSDTNNTWPIVATDMLGSIRYNAAATQALERKESNIKTRISSKRHSNPNKILHDEKNYQVRPCGWSHISLSQVHDGGRQHFYARR